MPRSFDATATAGGFIPFTTVRNRKKCASFAANDPFSRGPMGSSDGVVKGLVSSRCAYTCRTENSALSCTRPVAQQDQSRRVYERTRFVFLLKQNKTMASLSNNVGEKLQPRWNLGCLKCCSSLPIACYVSPSLSTLLPGNAKGRG